MWRFIDVDKCQVLLELDNLYKDLSFNKEIKLDQGIEMRFMGLLVNEKDFYTGTVDDDEEEIFKDKKNESDSSNSYDS